VEVPALAARFGVSEDTIRRDLRLLATHGLAQKTHGGAVALFSGALPATQRQGLLAGPKRAIGIAAAALAAPHQTIFIDAGTTALAAAQALATPDAPRPLSIITAALDVAMLFARDPNVRLAVAGGAWAPDAAVCLGEQAEATIRAHRADWVLLGACAIHPRLGLTTIFEGDARLKRAMIDSAAQVVVLADATKHDTVAPFAVAGLNEVDHVITDAEPAWLRSAVRRVTIVG
jgi:DeoR/GlpR family transcriptional regulator of sugar metabolism